jgi:hypothetical protein
LSFCVFTLIRHSGHTFRAIIKKKQLKTAKILRGGIPTKLRQKKEKLDVEEKKNKKNKKKSWNTALTPTPLQNPPHKPKRSGVCVSATVLRHKKEIRSSIKRKEVN